MLGNHMPKKHYYADESACENYALKSYTNVRNNALKKVRLCIEKCTLQDTSVCTRLCTRWKSAHNCLCTEEQVVH